MPIYEYRCPNGHLFEVFHRMDDPPPAACEVCGAKPLEKVLHPVPIFFKGKGFYSTDYGRGSRKRESKDGDSSPSSDGAKKTEKAETKPKKAESASGSD
jgi:putative FmdB family regulatory protein